MVATNASTLSLISLLVVHQTANGDSKSGAASANGSSTVAVGGGSGDSHISQRDIVAELAKVQRGHIRESGI